MAEFIAESPRLLRLDLRENEIKTGGLMALSLALKVNHSLLRLDLDREPKKESVGDAPPHAPQPLSCPSGGLLEPPAPGRKAPSRKVMPPGRAKGRWGTGGRCPGTLPGDPCHGVGGTSFPPQVPVCHAKTPKSPWGVGGGGGERLDLEEYPGNRGGVEENRPPTPTRHWRRKREAAAGRGRRLGVTGAFLSPRR